MNKQEYAIEYMHLTDEVSHLQEIAKKMALYDVKVIKGVTLVKKYASIIEISGLESQQEVGEKEIMAIVRKDGRFKGYSYRGHIRTKEGIKTLISTQWDRVEVDINLEYGEITNIYQGSFD